LKKIKECLPEIKVWVRGHFLRIAENGPSHWTLVRVVAGKRPLPSEQEDALSLMVMKAKHSG